MLDINSANSFIHFLNCEHETKLPKVKFVLLKSRRHHGKERVFFTKKFHCSNEKEANHHADAKDADSSSKIGLVLAALPKSKLYWLSIEIEVLIIVTCPSSGRILS